MMIKLYRRILKPKYFKGFIIINFAFFFQNQFNQMLMTLIFCDEYNGIHSMS